MSVTLAVADNLDGTGGVATVAGSNVASSNTLYRSPWTGQTGSLTWTSVGSRTGDGTIAISATPAAYLFRLDNLLAGVTETVLNYQPLTDATAKGIAERIHEAARDRIRGLNLTGISSSNIVCSRWAPRMIPGVETPPVIVVSPIGAETFPGVLTTQDDIGIPFAVTILDAQNQDVAANFSRNNLWREKILSALRYQRLAGAPEVYTTIPEPAAIVNLAAFVNENLLYSTLVFRALTRTTRG